MGYSFEPEHHARYRWAALLAGRRVLDAGSGTGSAPRSSPVPVPAERDGFDAARSWSTPASGRDTAHFTVGDLNRSRTETTPSTSSTCFEAIEHVEDPFRALSELRRVLAPGGVLLVSTPNRGVYDENNPHHLHELSSEEFERAVRERFAYVRILRQQTHATSLLAGDETALLADSAVPLELDVRKITRCALGDELYTVAAASGQPLPDLPELAVLGSAVDLVRATSGGGGMEAARPARRVRRGV